MEDRVPGNAGRPGGRFGNLETTAISRRACNKANEETYRDPLLVNIKLF